jgi:hypothetical protein
MTWKDELVMFWIFCTVVITFAAHHFFGGAVYMVEQMAAFNAVYLPGLLHLLARRLP